jgi:tRNA A-37 threonylcarbamoyl transferase component Bud32
MREETPKQDINEFNNRNSFLCSNKQKNNEKGISLKVFLQFFDIQEFLCERIFNYLDKSGSGKLTKKEFTNGLRTIFFGNIKELCEFTFSLCDFNNSNKIHQINMKLILSYIPAETYEEQNEYFKRVNSIMNHHFIHLDKEYPDKNIRIEKEIDSYIYESSIEEYILDENKKDSNFNNNGSYFLFISLISYIYNHHPFVTENMNCCQFLKNKNPIKFTRYNFSNSDRGRGYKLISSNEKKNTKNTLLNKNLDKIKQNFKDNEFNSGKDILPPINLYHTQKRSTSFNQANLPKCKTKKVLNLKDNISEEEYKMLNTKNNIICNKNNKFKIITDSGINSLMKSSKISNRNSFKISQIIKNTISIKKDPGMLILSQTLHNKISNKYNTNKNQEEEDFFLDLEENAKVQNDVKKNDVNSNDVYNDIVFKYNEEENSKIIKKYSASIRGKDILFFSKSDNELLTIWNISQAIIKTSDKIEIGKYSFYPIKFTNFNGSHSTIFFEKEKDQMRFAKICAENIHFRKIENLFEIKEKIGQGHFGVVKKCIEKSTQKEYAVKIMNKSKIKEKDFRLIIQERNYMSLIKHPSIVSLIQSFEDETYLYFVMEYFKGGDLSKYVSKCVKSGKNMEKISAKIIKTIAHGIQYLNHFGIVHRDLKPDNIIFEKEDDIKSIKIIDLGVAITLPYGKQSSDPIGTLTYIAPEILAHKSYSNKVDVWSIGVILYYLATGGVLPFDDEKYDESTIGKKIVFTHQEYPDKYFGDKNKSLMSVIDKALEKDPDKRININDFLKEEWLIKYSN